VKKNETWIKTRHKVVVFVLRWTLGIFAQLRYGIKIEKFREEGKRPYLILMNHQTAFDQFFVGITFHQPVYYLASEDLFSMGWVSRLIRWLVAPIPIKKQAADLQAVKNCIRVAREGGSICIAPEGHRTFHGKTVYIKPTIATLAKKLGMPIAIFRIEGGYGVQPRWSDVIRRGKMRSFVKRVMEPEEYNAMTADALNDLIEQELMVDEAKVTGQFIRKKNAEFLERAMYVCPWCGLSELESHGDRITCKKCGRAVRHLPTKELEGVNCQFPHRFVADWYQWQSDYINDLDLTALTDAPLYTETVRLSLVHPCKNKELLKKETTLCLYGDRIILDGQSYPFDQLSAITLLGKNKLNVYVGSDIYQLKGEKRFNGLKYVHFIHRWKNIRKGEPDDKFLGL
jgi:1-acyl-sn-glycerol-3-phosphate acyltransferase